MTFNMDKKQAMMVALLAMVLFVPMVSAVWYNPFTWFGDNYDVVQTDGWFVQYTHGIQEENFDTTIEQLGNGKAKLCLIPKTELLIDGEIVLNSVATLRQNNIQTRTVEPADMEKESEQGKLTKLCIDVDKADEDYAKFGEHSIVFEYTSELATIKDGDNNTILEAFLITEDFEYRDGKPNVIRNPGYDDLHTIKLVAHDNLTNVLNDLKIIDMNTGLETDKEIDIKLRYNINIEINTTDVNCTYSQNGTETCTDYVNGSYIGIKYGYMDLGYVDNSLNLTDGEEVYLTFFAYLEAGEYGDLIPKMAGVEFDFWASWLTTTLNDGLVQAYYLDDDLATANVIDELTFDDGTLLGSNSEDVHNTTGVIEANFFLQEDAIVMNSSVSAESAYTWSFWFKQNDLGGAGSGCLMSINSYGDGTINSGLIMGNLEDTQKISIGKEALGLSFANDGVIYDDGVWHYVIGTIDGDTYGFYVDNATSFSASITKAGGTFSDQLVIGGCSYSTGVGAKWKGAIDEFYVWNRVLSAQERHELYNLQVLGIRINESDDPVDNPPVVTLITPANETISNSATLSFNCTCEDATGCNTLNLTLDGQQVNTTVNVSTSQNLTLVYTNTSIPDGIHNWHCTGNSDTSNATNSSLYLFTIDATVPEVNITNPLTDFIVTQYNQSINLNWTVLDDNPDTCWYDGVDRNITDAEITTFANITPSGSNFFNFGINSSSVAVSDVFIQNAAGVKTIFNEASSTSTWTQPVSLPICYNETFSKYNIVMGDFTNKYVCFKLNNSRTVLMKIIGNGLFNWTYYEVPVNCTDNTTVINYPTHNPSQVTITLYANDTLGNSNNDSSTIYKSTSSPVITLSSPVTLYSSLTEGESVDVNWSITNVTVLDYCWYAYNGSNTTVTCEDLTNTFNYSNSVNTLTFFANDTLGNINSATVSWIVLAVTQDIIYEAEVVETNTTQFIAIVNLSEGVLSVVGDLVYNGVSYTAVPVIGGNQTNLTRSIDVPDLGADTNVSFHFNLTVTTVNGTGNTVTPSNTQLVRELTLTNCVAGSAGEVIDYTTKVARSPFALLNTSFKSTWYFRLFSGGGTVLKNTSYEDLNENTSSQSFCVNYYNETILTSNQVEASAVGYANSDNFLVSANLTTNITSQILYLLNDSLADATVLQVYDQSGFPIGNVLINVQYFDIGTNSFITVTQALTSSIGSDVIYLNWLDSLYKFVLVQNGETVETTLPENIFESPRIFTLGEDNVFNFLEFQDIDYNIYYNNITQNFVLTFARPDGKFTEGCLRVNKKATSGDTNICDDCSTAASATLLCDITGYGDGTYIATFYATGSPASAIDWIIQVIGDNFSVIIFEEIGAEDATFYAFMLGLLVVGLMFVNPVAGIVGILLSVFIGNILGFVIIDYITFVGLAITGGIIAWLIKG